MAPLNTKDLVCFFTSVGKVYCIKAYNLPQTTGFGDPVQSMFKFGDGERIVGAIGFVKNGASGKIAVNDAPSKTSLQSSLFDQLGKEEVRKACGEIVGEGSELLLATERGAGFRFSSDVLSETTKNGKKIGRVKGDDAVYKIMLVKKPYLFTLSSDGRGLLFPLKDVPVLSGAGAGVRLMKLKPGAILKGLANVGKSDSLSLTYMSGKDDKLKVSNLEKGARGTVGRVLAARRKKLLSLVG